MKIIETIRRKNNIVRAVIYARFSSDMQREESIEAQVRAIRSFADSNNIVIVGEYFDRAKSGTSADRQEFQRLIKDSAKRQFDLVLVHKVDRFARNRNDSITARWQLKRNGVVVLAVSQLYDAESPEGMMMEAMLEAMAEYFSKNLASEVEKGKRENALKGRHVGGKPPLGYDVDRDTMKLTVNEQEAEAVRLIFRLALDGDGYTEIIRELHMRGYKTKNGNDFGKNSLFSILKNEKYTGTYVYSKSASKDPDGKRNGHQYKDEADIIRVENALPVLVSKEDFDTVQKLMKKRSKRTASYTAKEVYLLSGKVICGECGSSYAGNRRKARPDNPQYVSYTCIKRNRSAKCHNGDIRRESLEAHVLDRLAKLVFSDDMIPTVVQTYNDYLSTLNTESQQEMKRLERRLKQVTEQIENLVKAIAETGSLALSDGLRKLETEKADLDSQLETLREKTGQGQLSESKIKLAFCAARNMLREKCLRSTKNLVDTFIDKVIIYQDHVEIKFNLGFDTSIYKQKPPGSSPTEYKGKNTPQDGVFLIGGEGGTRTPSKPKKLIKSLLIECNRMVLLSA